MISHPKNLQLKRPERRNDRVERLLPTNEEYHFEGGELIIKPPQHARGFKIVGEQLRGPHDEWLPSEEQRIDIIWL